MQINENKTKTKQQKIYNAFNISIINREENEMQNESQEQNQMIKPDTISDSLKQKYLNEFD